MVTMMRRVRWLAAGLLLLAGCGSGASTARVEGIVTLDGKPLPDIRVAFQPANKDSETAGVGSHGLTDSSGKFVLSMSDSSGSGALVGDHSVVLSDKRAESPEDTDAGGIGKQTKSRIPAKFAREPQSFTVKPGVANQVKLE
jgi:hypothetical protein